MAFLRVWHIIERTILFQYGALSTTVSDNVARADVGARRVGCCLDRVAPFFRSGSVRRPSLHGDSFRDYVL